MKTAAFLILLSYLLVTGFGYWLRYINLRHLKRHGADVPAGFEDAVDPELLRRTASYTFEQSRLGLWESLFDNAVLLLFLFGGGLSLYDGWVGSLTTSFVGGNLLFFLILTLLLSLLDIPFSLYGAFHIENRYGFNTMTLRTWFTDLLKSTLVSTLLLGLLGGGGLVIVARSPEYWWLWGWCFFAFATIFLMYLSPYVIEPLFNKFEPVKDKELEREIVAMMERAGLRVSRVMQVDASRRSRHSNAYFTGIGRVKRIVLYDTLLEQMTHREVLAVLAHEAGHWKKGHIWKRLVMTEAGALLVFYVAHALITDNLLPNLFGFTHPSFAAQLVLFSFLGSLAAFPLTPLSSWLSRRHEWQADRYAAELSGMQAELASALIKLTRENLANLHPHPLYASFYYSHPPVVERVRELGRYPRT